MKDINKAIAELSAEQLELLHRRLGRQKDQGLGRIPARSPESSTTVFPLSYGQQRYWFLQEMEPGSAAYNIPTALRIKGELNQQALADSINEVIRRHEILRTKFNVVDGQPVQQIVPSLEVSLITINLRHLPETEKESEMWRVGYQEAVRSFDLSRDSLLRAFLLILGERDSVLLLTTHHIICDRWSHGILMSEIVSNYLSYTVEQTLSLQTPVIQYADYACWQRSWLQGSKLESLLHYWQEKLAGSLPTLGLPTDYPRKPDHKFRAHRLPFVLGQEQTRELKKFSQREDCTPFMTMLAAFKTMLFLLTEEEDILVSILSANRTRPELANLIGQFANTVLIRTRPSPTRSLASLLAEVREEVLGAAAHQDLPFDKLVEVLRPDRAAGNIPLFQVAFNLQKAPVINTDLPNLSLTPFEIYRGPANLDLYVEFEEREQTFIGAWEFNAELFDAGTIEQWMQFYVEVLNFLMRHAENVIGDLKLPDSIQAKIENYRARKRKKTIAIAATYTAEPLADSLSFWMGEVGISANIEFAPFNQIFQQLLDEQSLLRNNQNGFNLILLRLEDWVWENVASADEAAARHIAECGEYLIEALKVAVSRTPAATYFVYFCPPPPSPAGSWAADGFLARTEAHLTKRLNQIAGVYAATSRELMELYPVEKYSAPLGEKLGSIPYNQTFFAALSTFAARRIYTLGNSQYKVIVVDCDDTLWRGGCAEEGAGGIRMDEAAVSFQNFLLRLQGEGKLICLCSRNEESDVWAVFDQRNEMPLKRDHIVASRINWRSKSDNIKDLATELRLGLDSFIFIDDDPVMCAEVRAHCPEVVTLQYLPPEPGSDVTYLEKAWIFDCLRITNEDGKRTSLYQQDARRRRLRQNALTLEEYLAQLNLRIGIAAPAVSEISRLAQLTERTNQFNSTGVRRTETEIQMLLTNSHLECFVVNVSDRFGDYGLVGAAFYKATPKALVVDSFMLSCRALGRGVEYGMLNSLGEIALSRGLEQLEMRFTPSPRNRPILDFFGAAGMEFRRVHEREYIYFCDARLAATVKHRADSSDVENEVSSLAGSRGPAQSSPHIARAADEAGLQLRLALELSSVERIEQAITLHTRRHRQDSDIDYVAPTTPIEEMLVDIWKKCLSVDRVGIHENFFKLGGHSLLVVMLMSAIADEFQIVWPLRKFFEMQTIATMGAAIEEELLAQTEAGSLTEMIHKIADLSDEDVNTMLGVEKSNGLPGIRQ